MIKKINKKDLKVGQKVAVKIEEMSNVARGIKMTLDNINEWCFDGIITKIGRKYITVDFFVGNNDITFQFNIEDEYRQKYSYGGANYRLYLSKEDVIEEYESNHLYFKIRNRFSSVNNKEFTLEQLKKIYSIID